MVDQPQPCSPRPAFDPSGAGAAPVFILGPHRSGTTLLYHLLAESGCFQCVTARHVICFDELEQGSMTAASARAYVDALLREAGVSDRVIDQVMVGPDMPEEYGFILANRGCGLGVTEQNIRQFLRICRVVLREGNSPGRLLLKNPWDFAKGPALAAMFPTARFVYIHRDPVAVVNSGLNVAGLIVTRRDPYLAMISRAYADLLTEGFPTAMGRWIWTNRPEWLLAKRWRSLSSEYRAYMASRPHMPAGSVIEVRYEDLCAEPVRVMGEVCAFLGIPAPAPELRERIQPRGLRLHPAVESARERLLMETQAYRRVTGLGAKQA